MPKKLTDRQRIIGYAMSATEDQLQDALETFKAIQAHRFPRQAKKPATARKSAKQPVLSMPEAPALAAILEDKRAQSA